MLTSRHAVGIVSGPPRVRYKWPPHVTVAEQRSQAREPSGTCAGLHARVLLAATLACNALEWNARSQSTQNEHGMFALSPGLEDISADADRQWGVFLQVLSFHSRVKM
jgi:hypothetical protein